MDTELYKFTKLFRDALYRAGVPREVANKVSSNLIFEDVDESVAYYDSDPSFMRFVNEYAERITQYHNNVVRVDHFGPDEFVMFLADAGANIIFAEDLV